FFFSSRRRHTRFSRDWSSDVCSSDLPKITGKLIICMHVMVFFLTTNHLDVERPSLPAKLPWLQPLLRLESKIAYSWVTSMRCARSEERRVGKKTRSVWGTADISHAYH